MRSLVEGPGGGPCIVGGSSGGKVKVGVRVAEAELRSALAKEQVRFSGGGRRCIVPFVVRGCVD